MASRRVAFAVALVALCLLATAVHAKPNKGKGKKSPKWPDAPAGAIVAAADLMAAVNKVRALHGAPADSGRVPLLSACLLHCQGSSTIMLTASIHCRWGYSNARRSGYVGRGVSGKCA